MRSQVKATTKDGKEVFFFHIDDASTISQSLEKAKKRILEEMDWSFNGDNWQKVEVIIERGPR